MGKKVADDMILPECCNPDTSGGQESWSKGRSRMKLAAAAAFVVSQRHFGSSRLQPQMGLQICLGAHHLLDGKYSS